ncbi:MAG: metallophosphoesterase [Clostridiales bacterium]|nr:metallophosphoesterase [Clostridiales bacterium]
MKILVLADIESKYLYDCYLPGKLDGIDLILACGDLEPEYLEFFATLCHAPVLYILGNHDKWAAEETKLPGGCICIEDTIYVYKGLRILGLGGSMQYHPGAPQQYTENQMRRRILQLWWKLIRHRGIDILVTHAPAAGIHDLLDRPHRGFECFRAMLEQYHPKLFVHGHVHANYGGFVRKDRYQDTIVINAYDHYIVELPEA